MRRTDASYSATRHVPASRLEPDPELKAATVSACRTREKAAESGDASGTLALTTSGTNEGETTRKDQP